MTIYQEMKRKFQQEIEEEEQILRQKQLFGNNGQLNTGKRSGVGFFQSKKAKLKKEEAEWFDLDVSTINETLPLLILNPPMGTKLRPGDTILALGKMPP